MVLFLYSDFYCCLNFLLDYGTLSRLANVLLCSGAGVQDKNSEVTKNLILVILVQLIYYKFFQTGLLFEDPCRCLGLDENREIIIFCYFSTVRSRPFKGYIGEYNNLSYSWNSLFILLVN